MQKVVNKKSLGVIMIHMIQSGDFFSHLKRSIMISHQCLFLSIQKRLTRLLNLEILVKRYELVSNRQI